MKPLVHTEGVFKHVMQCCLVSVLAILFFNLWILLAFMLGTLTFQNEG